MTASRDPDRLIRAFLEEGDDYLQDQVYDAVRAEIEHKRQRAMFGLRSAPTMNKYLSIGLGTAAVVVIGLFLGYQLLGSPTDLGGPSEPTATPEPTATSQPSVAEPTSTAEAFLPKGPFVLGDAVTGKQTTVTIPDSGWSFVPEFGALAKGDEVDNLPEAAILFPSWEAGTGFYVYGDPCRWQSTTPETPATTVDEITAALAAQASRDASEPVDVTVGGYTGKAITLHVPDDASPDDCEGGEFGTFGTAPDALDRYQQGAGQVDELWILDVDGSIVIIDAMYRPNSRMDIVDEMRSIAESATFEVP
jgi:hypothetical protein